MSERMRKNGTGAAARDALVTAYGRVLGEDIGTPIEGGWRIKTNTAGTHYIDILVQTFNYRVCTTPVGCPMVYDRYWCFAGRTQTDLLRTVLAAMAWDGADGTEPIGWNKNGQTQEWRSPENTE